MRYAPHTTTQQPNNNNILHRGSRNCKANRNAAHGRLVRSCRAPAGLMPTHEFSTFPTLVFTFFLLGAKRLAFNGVVDWVTGPLCPMLFIGLFSIFCSFFNIIIFDFLFFLPEGWSTEQQQKTVRRVRSPYELFRFPIDGLLFFLPAALAGNQPHPPVRQEKEDLTFLPLLL